MRIIHAENFRFYVPQASEGERRSCIIPIGGLAGVTCEVRCPSSAVLNGITKNGETVCLAVGVVCEFDGRLEGFSALEVVASEAFAYCIRQKGRWLEIPDPVPVAVAADEPTNKPIADLVRQELQKYLARHEMDTALSSDVSVEELLEDIQSGDLDFEDEPDPFGLGYEERLKEFQAAADALPPAEQPKPAEAPAAAPNAPAAEPGDGSKTQITT